jgi:hypothetical protein
MTEVRGECDGKLQFELPPWPMKRRERQALSERTLRSESEDKLKRMSWRQDYQFVECSARSEHAPAGSVGEDADDPP